MKTPILETTLLSVLVGLGLSAACGFRIFVPLLAMSLATRAGFLSLASGFDWIASTPALIAFGAATLLEVCAYYIPVVDNFLDTIAMPSAIVAGALVTGSQVADMHPFLAWSVAIIAGGGTAGLIQGLTTVTRQFSTLATAGLGNPIFSTFEAGASLGMTLLAIFVPIAAVIGLLLLIFFGARKVLIRNSGKTAGLAV